MGIQKEKDGDVVDKMRLDIKWLNDHKKSTNVSHITTVLDSLTINAITLGEMVSDAYELMNNLEDDYDIAKAEFIKVYDGSNAAAKMEVDADKALVVKRKAFTEAKNGYKRLNMFLDRVDKLLDAHKQRVSVVKQTDLKHV